MDRFYSFVDFLNNNAIEYKKKEIEISDDHPNYVEVIQRKAQDSIDLEPDEYFEEYFEELPTLNGYEDIIEFEEYIKSNLRSVRDLIARQDLKFHETNRNQIVIDLNRSIKTLLFFKNASTYKKVNEEGEEQYEIESPNLINLQPYISNKLEAINELLQLLGEETKKVPAKHKPNTLGTSLLTKNQIVILTYFLLQEKVILNELSQSYVCEMISSLTGVSSETLRQTFSRYKNFITQNDGSESFPTTDHNAVRKVLARISKELDSLSK